MPKFIIAIALVAACALSGCIKTSIYQPNWDGYPKQAEIAKTIQGTIVEDELGHYYFKLYNDDKYVCFLNYNSDLNNVTNLLSKGIGLVEPIYMINHDWTELTVNWELTAKLIDDLNNNGFNVYSIEYTKKYHELLMSKINAHIKDRTKTGLSLADSALRDKAYVDEVIYKISKFDYLVMFNSSEATELYMARAIYNRIPTQFFRYKMEMESQLAFRSVDMIRNIRTAGDERCYTCLNTATVRCRDIPRTKLRQPLDSTDQWIYNNYDVCTKLLWEAKKFLKIPGAIKTKTFSE